MRKWFLVLLSIPLVTGDQCDITNDYTRTDCYPDSGAREDLCIQRGCCWRLPNFPTDPSLNPNVPYCYYPLQYQGYAIINSTSTKSGTTAFLKRITPSRVAPDINTLRVDIIEQTENIVRVKITDANATRWEPPLPKISDNTNHTSANKYEYKLSNASLQITRSETGVAIFNLDLSTLLYTDTLHQATSSLPSDTIYGLGEHKGRLKRSVNYSRFTFYNTDDPPAYNIRLYGYQPLYINIEGSTHTNAVWLRSSNALDVILQPAPSITYRAVGGILDFFVLLGPTPTDVVQQYQSLVGLPQMPPYWSLGFHLCRFGYTSTDDTRKVLNRNLDAGIRVDVQWNDIDYMNDRNGFTIDPNNYAGLGRFVDDLHLQGRHYIPIVDPAVSGSERKGTYPPYDRGLDYDVFIRDAQGKIAEARVWNLKSSVFPDFTHRNATAYWTELFSNFYKQIKLDGVWIDMNEPANMLNGHFDGCPSDTHLIYIPGDVPLQTKTLCNTDQQNWTSHFNVHNMYGFTESIATYNAMTAVAPGKRPFIISRSTFSGSGAYVGHWTGDIFSTWTDLRDSVSGILEFAFYGIPMVGADICGFNGNTNEALCARWQALGAFYPFSRNHNTENTVDQDPAAMGDLVVNATKNAYYWRYKLLPYLYTLFYYAHTEGKTVARPMFFDHYTDRSTYDNDDQFFWGDALMVVPALYQNQDKIEAYFPQAIWYDLQNITGTVDASLGSMTKYLPAIMDRIHFFMKGGHIVFYQEPGDTTTTSRLNPYGVYVFLDKSGAAKGTQLVDSGDGIDNFKNYEYSIIYAVAGNSSVTISRYDSYKFDGSLDEIHVYGVKTKPTSATCNGNSITSFTYDESQALFSVFKLNTPVTNITLNYS